MYLIGKRLAGGVRDGEWEGGGVCWHLIGSYARGLEQWNKCIVALVTAEFITLSVTALYTTPL